MGQGIVIYSRLREGAKAHSAGGIIPSASLEPWRILAAAQPQD
jgi:hypothetical protein